MKGSNDDDHEMNAAVSQGDEWLSSCTMSAEGPVGLFGSMAHRAM